MGFLDQLWGDVRNAAGQQEGKLPGLLLSALGGGSDPSSQAHGLSTLVSRFQQAGFGDLVQSWISNERQNEPVSADQVHHALGEQHVQALAQQSGLPKAALLEAIAAILPKLVDSMTPNGQLPTAPLDARNPGHAMQESGPAGTGKGRERAPDQSPGEAEAPPDSDAGTADEAVKHSDPTEPTRSA